MSTLVALPAWVVVLASLLCGLLVATGARVILRRWIPGGESGLAGVVGPLMPALGAVFALLSALALSNEAADLRSADQDIAAEAAAGVPTGLGEHHTGDRLGAGANGPRDLPALDPGERVGGRRRQRRPGHHAGAERPRAGGAGAGRHAGPRQRAGR